MKRMLVAAAILGLSVTGCSTARNLFPSEVHESPPLRVYGGTTAAWQNFPAAPKGTDGGPALVWPLAAVDLAASAVADTFTLPITLIAFVHHELFPEPVVIEPPPALVPWGMPPPGVPLVLPGASPLETPGL